MNYVGLLRFRKQDWVIRSGGLSHESLVVQHRENRRRLGRTASLEEPVSCRRHLSEGERLRLEFPRPAIQKRPHPQFERKELPDLH